MVLICNQISIKSKELLMTKALNLGLHQIQGKYRFNTNEWTLLIKRDQYWFPRWHFAVSWHLHKNNIDEYFTSVIQTWENSLNWNGVFIRKGKLPFI